MSKTKELPGAGMSKGVAAMEASGNHLSERLGLRERVFKGGGSVRGSSARGARLPKSRRLGSRSSSSSSCGCGATQHHDRWVATRSSAALAHDPTPSIALAASNVDGHLHSFPRKATAPGRRTPMPMRCDTGRKYARNPAITIRTCRTNVVMVI